MTMPQTPILSASRITKTYREHARALEVEVLRGIDLVLAPGELVALEGPSGSGKSTLLSVLGCILSPTTGDLAVCGRSVGAPTEADLVAIRRKCVGFVFQQYNLIPALTARENVELSLRVRGFSGSDVGGRAMNALAAVSLADRVDFLPRDLSGGQKQRVAIARALAGNAPLLLADEPTANLDTKNGGQILQLFREIADTGCAVLVVTHDPKVRRVADRCLGIRDGVLEEIRVKESAGAFGRPTRGSVAVAQIRERNSRRIEPRESRAGAGRMSPDDGNARGMSPARLQGDEQRGGCRRD